MTFYRSDLAFIHDDGFTQLASGAAQELLTALDHSETSRANVLDVGCGSGVTARLLADSGYSIVGVDVSESLVEMARQRVPEATFHVGSFVGLEIPPCVAVCAVGEVLNYGFDSRNGTTARLEFFQDVFRALQDGGVFLFDIAGHDRATNGPTRTFIEGREWTVLTETSAEAGVLTRRIVTFRRDGKLHRRDTETHQLHLMDPDELESELRSIGFHVTRLREYGDVPFPNGLYGFSARKVAT